MESRSGNGEVGKNKADKSNTGKRNYLMLALKYEVIKMTEREKKMGVCKLNGTCGCGKHR